MDNTTSYKNDPMLKELRYLTIMAVKACFHPTALPPLVAGKEKVRDLKRSKEYESNQLARRAEEKEIVGEKETGKEQEKVKDRERSEEYKNNQLTKRMGEKETDGGKNKNAHNLLKSSPRVKE